MRRDIMKMESKESISELWEKILHMFEKECHGISTFLNQPATKSQINAIEQKMGFPLPQELKELYLCNDGQGERVLGILSGLDFLSIEELYIQWSIWKELSQQETEEGMNELSCLCTSFPEGAIKKIYTNKKWIPLTHDGGGNHIGIDLDPDINGNIGQIINFGRDEDSKFIIATDLSEYLKLFIKLIEEGYFKIKKDDYAIFINFKDDCHPIDKYKKILSIELP
jgi:cell wall assembly regulator SMI1